MSFLGLFKPEYLFRPSNILRRLRFWNTTELPTPMCIQVRGRSFRVDPNEVIGRQVLHFGLFDLLVTEALLRLADPGELAVDVGANVGYTALVLAEAVGQTGRVLAFEPHPDIFAELTKNTAGLPVESVKAAVSDHGGLAKLHIPLTFLSNHGIASLEPCDTSTDVEVEAITLDQILTPPHSVGVMKIDIEGHELNALQGASSLLQEGRIRDIIIEEHNPATSKVVGFLTDRGYRIFLLHKTFFGPKLVESTAKITPSRWESPSLLATLDPHRAQMRFEGRGWKSLRNP